MRHTSFETESKSHLVRKVLLESLAGGEFKTGQQLPTEFELSDRFRVSRATIREAVSALVHEGWLTRVQGKGTFVAHKPAGRLSVAVVLPYLYYTDQPQYIAGTDVIPRVLQAIESECRSSRSNIMLMLSNHEIALERESLIRVLESDVNAILLNYIGGEENRDCLETILARRTPIVLIDRYLDHLAIDYVVTDNARGSEEAIAQLRAAGFDEILYVTAPITNSALRDRQAGYIRAMTALGRPAPVLMLEEALERLERVGDERIAFLSGDALHLASLWEAMQRRDDRYEQFALAGFDEPYLSFPAGLTVIKVLQPLQEIGRRSVQLAREQVNQSPKESRTPRQIQLLPTIHISTRDTGWNFLEVRLS